MEFLDLFSGIGGFRRGLERSGHKCVGHVEIDKYANISYMAMYGLSYCKYENSEEGNICRICDSEVREHCDGKNCKSEWFAKDIKQLGTGEIPKAEIWTFGFPCQDISLSGRRAGLAGKRSGLFFTVAGLLKSTKAEDKPRFLIVENVKHLMSSEDGGDFTTVLLHLWEAGYDLEWQCVNSKDFGVPQNRERVYLVGYFGGRGGRKVFPLTGANTASVKKIIDGSQGARVYSSKGLSVTLTAEGGGVGGKTGLYLCETKKPEEWMKCFNEQDLLECGAHQYAGFISYKKEPDMTQWARCLVAHYDAGITRFGTSSGVLHCTACMEKCTQARATLTPERMEKRQNGRRFKEDGEPGFTLTAVDRHGVMLLQCPYKMGLPIKEATKKGYVLARHGDGINLAYPNSKVRRGRVGKQCAQTLLTESSMGVLVYCRIRKLTPKECFRLQAFEDYLFERAKAAGVSDAQLYRQAGNSVTVNIVYEIGVCLAEMEDKYY
ncbi:DNA (cytosine-5)-methyltransferase 1 [Kineothrix alysoides]|uniref:DNA (cytosine-5-)-methyltransferase n=1 Tax=Kineothrix alysoides TaxID=1469948 RepID=A0A4R1QUL0_9FIRM|nr:DNA (cytosine-5-)-methyltransferase [Kineothrix alysoides]TCL57659.1 DNA (cytosine-5)-methyltransferase 1 [Kineothrix alysoides]